MDNNDSDEHPPTHGGYEQGYPASSELNQLDSNNSLSPEREHQTRSQRHQAERKARAIRQEQSRRDRRRRWFWRGGILAVIVAAAAVVTIVLVTSARPPQAGPENMASDGILITKGLKAERTPGLKPGEKPIPNVPPGAGQVTNIVIYTDYLCPLCGQFTRTNDPQLKELLNSGAATVEIHPLPFLNGGLSQGTKYSLRAANAAACVAQYAPDSFFSFNDNMFADQPAQGSAGLSNDRMVQLAQRAGAGSLNRIRKCINDGTFNVWAQDALNRALAGPIPNSKIHALESPPLILVDGQSYTGSLTSESDFRAFILQAQSQSYASLRPPVTASPTPTNGGSTVSSTNPPTTEPGSASPTPSSVR